MTRSIKLLALALCLNFGLPKTLNEESGATHAGADKLLYVFDLVSHGSSFPKTNVGGMELESERGKRG